MALDTADWQRRRSYDIFPCCHCHSVAAAAAAVVVAVAAAAVAAGDGGGGAVVVGDGDPSTPLVVIRTTCPRILDRPPST